MKKFFALTAAFLMVQGAFLFAEETITLKIGTVAPPNSPWDIELKKLASEWTKITAGTVRVQFKNMTALGGEKAAIQKMTARRPGQRAPLDGAIFTSVGLHELAPKARIYTLCIPFLIRTQEELDFVLEKFGGEVAAEYEKVGVRLLAWSNVGWIRFYTKNSYSDVAGLKKQKIASSGFDSSALSNALKVAGFTMVDIPVSRVSQSLKTGTAEGIYTVPLAACLSGDFKAVKYGLDTRICPVMAGLVMSKESWDLIPEKYHSQMEASLERMVEKLNAELERYDVEYTDRMKKQGLQLITLTPEQVQDWDKTLTEDMLRASTAYPDVFNLTLYSNIKTELEKKRQ